MRVLICGGRTYRNAVAIHEALKTLPSGAVVVHGAARGADSIAGELWRRMGGTVEEHPADWNRHGRAAGPIRNAEMLASGIDLVLAFPGGFGTADMVRKASKAGVEVRACDERGDRPAK